MRKKRALGLCLFLLLLVGAGTGGFLWGRQAGRIVNPSSVPLKMEEFGGPEHIQLTEQYYSQYYSRLEQGKPPLYENLFWFDVSTIIGEIEETGLGTLGDAFSVKCLDAAGEYDPFQGDYEVEPSDWERPPVLYEGEAISWNDLRPGDRVKVVYLNRGLVPLVDIGVEAVRVEVLKRAASPQAE